MFNPILFISTRIVRLVVRRINLSTIFLTLAPQLFNIARLMIRREGLIPTLGALFAINREIRSSGSVNNIISRGCSRPLLYRTLVEPLIPDWRKILKERDKINKYFIFYTFGIVFSAFPSIIFKIIRFSGGLIFSSLGIFYTNLIPDASMIKSAAKFLLSKFQDILQIDLIRDNSFLGFIKKVPKSIKDVIIGDNNSILSYFAIALIGLIAFTCGILVWDVWNPDMFDNVPVIETYVETIKKVARNSYSWIRSFFEKPKIPQPTQAEIAATERPFRMNPAKSPYRNFHAQPKTPSPEVQNSALPTFDPAEGSFEDWN